MCLSNIGFRLVSTASSERWIRVKNIDVHICNKGGNKFSYKKGYDKFVKGYKSPYFYIVENSPE
jgi:hypothetical protein